MVDGWRGASSSKEPQRRDYLLLMFGVVEAARHAMANFLSLLPCAILTGHDSAIEKRTGGRAS